MAYQLPSAAVPKITSIQERMRKMGLFRDKVNGQPGMTTWEAAEAALIELERLRAGTPARTSRFNLAEIPPEFATVSKLRDRL